MNLRRYIGFIVDDYGALFREVGQWLVVVAVFVACCFIGAFLAEGKPFKTIGYSFISFAVVGAIAGIAYGVLRLIKRAAEEDEAMAVSLEAVKHAAKVGHDAKVVSIHGRNRD